MRVQWHQEIGDARKVGCWGSEAIGVSGPEDSGIEAL